MSCTQDVAKTTADCKGLVLGLVVRALGGRSSLARLHVGRDGSPCRQPFKAFVGVVDEDPVLVLQVRLWGG